MRLFNKYSVVQSDKEVIGYFTLHIHRKYRKLQLKAMVTTAVFFKTLNEVSR